MVVKVTQADNEGSIRFLLSYCGLSWYTTVKIEDLQFVVRNIQTAYPNLAAFTQRCSLAEEFLALEPFRLNKSQGIELVNKFMQELAKFEVVRSDLSFRILF